jgi:hypothetical protein
MQLVIVFLAAASKQAANSFEGRGQHFDKTVAVLLRLRVVSGGGRRVHDRDFGVAQDIAEHCLAVWRKT